MTTLYALPGGRVVLSEVLDSYGLRLRDLEQAVAVSEYRTISSRCRRPARH